MAVGAVAVHQPAELSWLLQHNLLLFRGTFYLVCQVACISQLYVKSALSDTRLIT